MRLLNEYLNLPRRTTQKRTAITRSVFSSTSLIKAALQPWQVYHVLKEKSILLLISDLGVIHSRVDDGVTLGQDGAVTLLAIILS